jgi:hypothetical protein
LKIAVVIAGVAIVYIAMILEFVVVSYNTQCIAYHVL